MIGDTGNSRDKVMRVYDLIRSGCVLSTETSGRFATGGFQRSGLPAFRRFVSWCTSFVYTTAAVNTAAADALLLLCILRTYCYRLRFGLCDGKVYSWCYNYARTQGTKAVETGVVINDKGGAHAAISAWRCGIVAVRKQPTDRTPRRIVKIAVTREW